MEAASRERIQRSHFRQMNWLDASKQPGILKRW